MLFGIDVSYAQGMIDWAEIKANGKVQLAYCRATYGLDVVDDWYQRNLKVLRMRGIPRGAYHFFLPQCDPEKQAWFFTSTAGLWRGDLVPMIDVEVTGGLSGEAVCDSVTAFLAYVEKRLNCKVLIYSYWSFLHDFLQGYDGWSGHGLWIAMTDNPSDPKNLEGTGWKDWFAWQYGQGRLAGISGLVDYDTFKSMPEQLS